MGSFEERLKLSRKYAKLSQKKLAKLLGVSERTYQRYEDDATALNIEISSKIVKVCGVNPTWFLMGKGDIVDNDKSDNDVNAVVNISSANGNHFNVIQQFDDYDVAIEINQDLVIIEKESREAFDRARNIIKGIREGVSAISSGNHRKKDAPCIPDRRQQAK